MGIDENERDRQEDKAPGRRRPPADPGPLVEGRDYLIESDGLLVFTEAYHLRRGYCCESGCRHCPYGFDPEAT